jgi:hypothetical protein
MEKSTLDELDRPSHWKMWILRKLFPDGLRVVNLNISSYRPNVIWVRFGRSLSTAQVTPEENKRLAELSSE